MDRFFALKKGCFLINGAKRGAIYELNSGDIYSIDGQAKTILCLCEEGLSVDEITQRVFGVNAGEVIKYLQSLETMELGSFSNTKISTKRFPEKPEVKLNFLWLELTKRCNQKCLHCYNDSGPTARRRNGHALSLEEWGKAIQEGRKMGAVRLQFTGGEPMLFGKQIFFLTRLARIIGYETVEIFTNATLFADDDIDQLAEFDIRVATNIYSKRSEIHDQITGLKGSLEKTLSNIQKMQNKGVKVFLATILMKQNEPFRKETVAFLKQTGELTPLKHFDVVRPAGRGKNEDVVSESTCLWSRRKKPIFSRVTKEKFTQRLHGHSCWWGNAVITCDGGVLPCIMTDIEPCGNVKTESLAEIIEGPLLKQFWCLSKDKIPICRDCEYRYACLDCRPLAMDGTADLYSRNTHCNYDPYSGEWLQNN